jgi:hypothetical protein
MGKPEVNISKTQFIYLYVDQKKSGLEIARYFGIGRTTVDRYIKRYGLQRRTISEVRQNKSWNSGEQQRAELSRRMKGLTGEKNPNYKGGHIDPNGYRIIYVDTVKIKEHRHVMEQFLGRKLTRDEEVHHINGDKLDNRIDNLTVLSKKAHSNLHWGRIERRQLQSDKIRDARSKKYWSTRSS